MAQTNVQLVEELYRAFASRDLARILELFHPEVEVSQSAKVPWGGHYEGLAGLQEFFGRLASYLDSTLSIERMIDAGDHVVAIGRTHGKVLTTGEPFDVPFAHVWELRDGQARRFQPYIDLPTMHRSLAAGTASK